MFVGELGEVAALAEHPLDVFGDDLGADRAGRDARRSRLRTSS